MGRLQDDGQIQRWLLGWLGARPEVDARAVAADVTFERHGLASVTLAGLAAELAAATGRQVPPSLLWAYPTPALLAGRLGADIAGSARPLGSSRWQAGEPAPRPARGLDEPIALIGCACRFPGAPGPAALWHLLLRGGDAIGRVPAERWGADELVAAGLPEVPEGYLRGGFVPQVDRFDPQAFGISPREAEQMDPQQRLALELAWEALEDAGVPTESLRDSAAGVFMGVIWRDFAALHQRRAAELTPHSGTGQALDIVANRISYVFGLRGPSLAIDTACSSSLVAVHLACQSLRAGECSLALAGGVSLMLAPETAAALARFGGLSAGGRCRPFDAGADGYVRGEGGGVCVLKPLSRALRDGDPILCLVAGSAVNNDGASNGLTAPNPRAQEEVLEQALARSGLAPAQVHAIEAHGTGTPLGDPIEAAALGAVYARGRPAGAPLLVGSIKGNIGHLEGAAGVAGLIKAALAVRHRAVPPSLHFDRCNPQIPLAELGLDVPRAALPWPRPERAAAGVSSFGWGGTNCHLIVQELGNGPAAHGPAPARVAEGANGAEAAKGAKSANGAEAAEGVEATKGAKSAEAVERADAVDGAAAAEAGPSRRPRSLGPPPGVVLVCAPQGSQWRGMAWELVAREPVFRAAFARCDQAFLRLAHRSLFDDLVQADREGWPEEGPWEEPRCEEIRRQEDEAAWPDRPVRPPRQDGTAQVVSGAWSRCDFVQPLILAVQVSLAELWRSWGVVPAAVVGHSVGEIAAAHIAGWLALEQAIEVVYHYSRWQARLAGRGGMAVVELSPEGLAGELGGAAAGLVAAAYNAPDITVLSGGEAGLGTLLAEARSRGVRASRIPVDVAAHSPQIDEIADGLRASLAGVRWCEAGAAGRWSRADGKPVTMLSSVTARPFAPDGPPGDYWAGNLRRPVLFRQAVARLAVEGGHRVFLQLDPHPVLGPALERTLAAAGCPGLVLASMRRHEGESASLRHALAALREACPEEPAPRGTGAGRLHLLPLSAHSEAALRELARDVARDLARDGARDVSPGVAPDGARTASREAAGAGAAQQVEDLALRDLCFTASLRRSHLKHRLAVVARSRRELVQALESHLKGASTPACFHGVARALGGDAPAPPETTCQPSEPSVARDPGHDGLLAGPACRDAGEREARLRALASSWTAGNPVDWGALHPEGGRHVGLPSYPWQRQRYWPALDHRPGPAGPAGAAALGQAGGFDHQGEDRSSGPVDLPGAADPRRIHPLAGRMLRSPWFEGSLFEAWIGPAKQPFLAQHRIHGLCVLPFAALIEALRAAAAESLSHGAAGIWGAGAAGSAAPPLELEDVTLLAPMLLPEGSACEVQIGVAPAGPRGTATVRLFARATGSETGALGPAAPADPVAAAVPAGPAGPDRAIAPRAPAGLGSWKLHATATARLLPAGAVSAGPAGAWLRAAAPSAAAGAHHTTGVHDDTGLHDATGVAVATSAHDANTANDANTAHHAGNVAETEDAAEAAGARAATGAHDATDAAGADDADNAAHAEFEKDPEELAEELPVADLRAHMAAAGFQHGRAFSGLRGIWLWRGTAQARVEVELPPDLHPEAGRYHVHPALLDAAFQGLLALVPDQERSGPALPFSARRVRLGGPVVAGVAGAAHMRVRRGQAGETWFADLELRDSSGAVVVAVEELALRRASRDLIGRLAGERKADAASRPRPVGQAAEAEPPPPAATSPAATPAEPQAPRPGGRIAREVLAARPAARRRILAEHVRDLAARVLGLAEPAALRGDEKLFEAGLDSMMALDLEGLLEEGIGTPLRATVVFTNPTVDSLTDHLATEVLGLGEAAAEKGARPGDGAPAPLAERLSRMPGSSAAGALEERLARMSDSEAAALLEEHLAVLEGGARRRE